MSILKKSNFFISTMALLLVFTTFISAGVNVYASDLIANSTTEKEQIEQISNEFEKELIFLFEEAVTNENGQIKVNKELLIDKYGVDMAPYVAEGISKIYTADNLTQQIDPNYTVEPSLSLHARGSWISCMKGEIVGLIPGIDLVMLFSDGNLAGYLEGKAWGKAASYIATKAVKLGLKTNPAGIAASLAVSSGVCLLPWH